MRFTLYPRYQCRVPHISLVFRGMWETTALSSSLSRVDGSTWMHNPPLCHPDRSVAQWREVEGPAVSVVLSSGPGHNKPPLCHLDRSAAQWRDLRSSLLDLLLKL